MVSLQHGMNENGREEVGRHLEKQQIIARQRSQHSKLRAHIRRNDVCLGKGCERLELGGIDIEDCEGDTLFAGDEEGVEGGGGGGGGSGGWGMGRQG